MTYVGRVGAGPRNGSRGSWSRLEQMAAGAAVVSTPRQALLGILLEATGAFARGGRPVLMPFWDNEAMQRAYNFVQLVVELDRQSPVNRDDPLGTAAEYRIAMDLAAALRSLAAGDEEEIRPCSSALRTIVRDTVELFSPAVGTIQLRTSVERLALPGFKRRALVLATSELVINALRHGFAGRGEGCLTVLLCHTGCGQARLRVTDDGWGIPAGQSPQPSGIVFDLASLLWSEPVYGITKDGGTFAEIDFPISA